MPKVIDYLAKNLKRLMNEGPDRITESALGKKSGYGQSGINRLLNPQKSPNVPQLDSVQKVADALNVEVWQLLSPDVQASKQAMKIAKDWMRLTEADRETVERLIDALAKKTDHL